MGMSPFCGMSSRTMSPSSAAAHQWAQVAPTLPAPTIVILARRMGLAPEGAEWALRNRIWAFPAGGVKGRRCAGPTRPGLRTLQTDLKSARSEAAPLPAAEP